jgi:hypothetical protein
LDSLNAAVKAALKALARLAETADRVRRTRWADEFIELTPEIERAGTDLLAVIEPPRKNDSPLSWAAEESPPVADQQPAGSGSATQQIHVPKLPEAGSGLAASVLAEDRAYLDSQRQEQARREEAEQRWKEYQPKLIRVNSALADFGAVLRTNWLYRHSPVPPDLDRQTFLNELANAFITLSKRLRSEGFEERIDEMPARTTVERTASGLYQLGKRGQFGDLLAEFRQIDALPAELQDSIWQTVGEFKEIILEVSELNFGVRFRRPPSADNDADQSNTSQPPQPGVDQPIVVDMPEPAPLPESILTIADPSFRQRATDAWRAASLLRRLMEQWGCWFYQLVTTGDADPGLALRMSEAVASRIRALCSLGVNMRTFNPADPDKLLRRFPVPPTGELQPAWQKDEEYRNRTQTLLRSPDWNPLMGELMGFLHMLETAPSVAFQAPPRGPIDEFQTNIHQEPREARLPEAPNTIAKPKRSTERGDGRTKLIAALTKHHQYADGGSLNLEPVGNNELADLADVSPSTASGFFSKHFGGHTKYTAVCRNSTTLAASLKLLNNEFAPHELYGRRPPDEDDRDE